MGDSDGGFGGREAVFRRERGQYHGEMKRRESCWGKKRKDRKRAGINSRRYNWYRFRKRKRREREVVAVSCSTQRLDNGTALLVPHVLEMPCSLYAFALQLRVNLVGKN